MKKVGFFKSIHLKFVLIYVLLILTAIQIIGVYFVRQLETQLVENFSTSLEERINLLAYNIEQEMKKTRDDTTNTIEEDIRGILQDFTSEDILEVRVINSQSKVLGTSNPYNQSKYVGKRTNELIVKQTLGVGTPSKKFAIDPNTGNRMRIIVSPIKTNNQEVIGAIYLIATMENVYGQMREINNIFATGTIIALAVTAALGILLARTITRPMSDMKKQAIEMAKGNFSRKVKIYGEDEIGQLALSFNNLTKKLQEANATTEGERRKLSSVLSHMTDGVIATDRKGRVILINEPALKMLNVPRETVLAKPIVEVLGIEEDHTFETLMSEQDSLILDFSSKNSPLILRASNSVIQKETGFINGLITVLHDITEQAKIDQDRREFVANVSHELRTPLTTMRSYIEALTEGAWEDKKIAPQFLDVTQQETERMIRLVNDLLKLSKMDSKDYMLQKDSFDVVSFLNRVIDRFELSKSSDVTFQRDLPNEHIYVYIDIDKITQVLDNIISNAMKYSPEGGTVTFHLKVQQQHVEICISDEGVGIPAKDLDKIFDRFYRVDKARTRKLGGTGLGLAIAKEMIEAHDGRIWAKSEEGKGTSIFFTLPLIDNQEDDWT
ncbi:MULTISPECIES: cell wall metabolism sensor histidine kinase WalK [Sutcliffiella]|uniref:histidine kinase n=1 Tax=Sutcliffiella cohnii TaxID=33932 RepID=A0A223KWT8_9BACI|nr:MULTISPECIES: cell wall metabolism sensor histidine kinase WalK [Sutcliffiella]AST93909.1 cell wall metabolism sensor histidine kinase WalK [Sutcliffiella cohnii]WBL15097.1 cell wall metabolism sensor histidine kinase WalK [Sutcliffiella sp. NC1]